MTVEGTVVELVTVVGRPEVEAVGQGSPELELSSTVSTIGGFAPRLELAVAATRD